MSTAKKEPPKTPAEMRRLEGEIEAGKTKLRNALRRGKRGSAKAIGGKLERDLRRYREAQEAGVK